MASQRPPRGRPGGQGQLLFVSLLACVAIIVVGSGADPEGTTWIGFDHIDTIVAVISLTVALIGLLMMLLLEPARRGRVPAPRRKRGGFRLFIFVGLALLLWRPYATDVFVLDDDPGALGSAGSSPVDESADPGPEAVAQTTDILLLVAVVGVMALGVWAVRRRFDLADVVDDEQGDDALTPGLAPHLAEALDQAGDQLSTSADPRAAVMAAYATLERSLARRGISRRRAETPGEHLRRALAGLAVDPEPLVRLGALYEVARFSRLPITEDDRRRAAVDLDRSRRDLDSVGQR